MSVVPVSLPAYGELIDLTRPAERPTREEADAALARITMPKSGPPKLPIDRRNRKPLVRQTFKATLKWWMSSIAGGEQTFIDVLRASIGADSMHEQAEDLVRAWDDAKTRAVKPSLDAICESLHIAPAIAYGWYATACYEQSINLSRGILSASIPAILQASIERALDVAEGHDERKLLMMIQGMLPKSGGVNVAIQQNNTPLPAGTADPGDPMGEFEAEQRRTTNALRSPRKALASPQEAIEGAVVESDPCTIRKS